MKRRVAFFLCLLLAVSVLTGATPPPETGGELKAGTYRQGARGHNGDIVLDVTFDNKAIVDISVVSHLETAMVSDAAFSHFIPSILAHQSLEVDAASGATFSCNGIRQAVAAAIEEAGGEPGDFMIPIEDDGPSQTYFSSYDVIVVGSGIAGMSAAIEARETGASVVVIEKLSHIGGNSLINGGFIYGVGSRHQAALGAETGTVEELVDYWLQEAEGNAEESMLRFVAARSGEVIDWYVDTLGADLPYAVATGRSGIARGLITGLGGYGFVKPLYDKCVELGVDFSLNTAGRELLVDETGRIIGVSAQRGRDVVNYIGSAVILATGGYDQSYEMKSLYSPIIANEPSFSSPGNTGDGIVMAQAVGAATSFKGGYIGFRGVPGYVYGDAITFLWPNGIMVNEAGERFMMEGTDYPVMHELMLADGSSVFYNIVDAKGYTPAWDRALAEGRAFKGESVEDLALALGLPSETLTATFERYNALCEKGVDEDFGKAPSLMTSLSEGPFYGVKCINFTIGSLGGICTDTNGRVLDGQGFSIPGLYAAGACANGQFFGTLYPASGTSVTMCTVFGRAAGAHAGLSATGQPNTHTAMRRETHVDRYPAQFVYSGEDALAICSSGAACFSNQQALGFVYTTTPEFARSVLPYPLEATENPLVYFMICDSDPYTGLVVQLSCKYKEYEGKYALGYVMESDTSTLFGRSFLGEPKKVGDIYLDMQGDQVYGKVLRHGEMICEMGATLSSYQRSAAPESLSIDYGAPGAFFHRYFLNPDGTGISHLQLIGMQSYSVPIASAGVEEAYLRVFDTGDDIYGQIPLLQCVSAFYSVSDLYVKGVVLEEELDVEAYLPYAFYDHDDYREAGFLGNYVTSSPNLLNPQ